MDDAVNPGGAGHGGFGGWTYFGSDNQPCHRSYHELSVHFTPPNGTIAAAHNQTADNLPISTTSNTMDYTRNATDYTGMNVTDDTHNETSTSTSSLLPQHGNATSTDTASLNVTDDTHNETSTSTSSLLTGYGNTTSYTGSPYVTDHTHNETSTRTSSLLTDHRNTTYTGPPSNLTTSSEVSSTAHARYNCSYGFPYNLDGYDHLLGGSAGG